MAAETPQRQRGGGCRPRAEDRGGSSEDRRPEQKTAPRAIAPRVRVLGRAGRAELHPGAASTRPRESGAARGSAISSEEGVRSEVGARKTPSPAASAAKPSGCPGAQQLDLWALPQSVRDRFIQDKRRFYFPDGAPAFRDHGKRLTTGSENTEVVRSLVEIARTRGWEEISVAGTERFRQEAWRQGRLAGLDVRGYKPYSARARGRGAGARAPGRWRTDGARVPGAALNRIRP